MFHIGDIERALLGKDRGINDVAKEKRREIVAEERIFRERSSRKEVREVYLHAFSRI